MERSERRQSRRVFRGGRASGQITRYGPDGDGSDQTFEATVGNISVLGIGINTTAELPDETLVTLEIDLDEGERTRHYKLKGEARWRTPPGQQGLHHVGILLTCRPRLQWRRWRKMVFEAQPLPEG